MLRRILRTVKTHPRYVALKGILDLPPRPGLRYTPRRALNLWLARMEMKTGRTSVWCRPSKLTVEATNICNLRCPACFTGIGDVGRARGHMSLDLYKQLIAELGPTLMEVEFYNWGEPLLAKHIFEMIEEASRRRIATTVSTNFSFPWDAARAERIVTSGLGLLGVSIDGARQESYEQYRRRGILATVLENCRLVRDAKRRLGRSNPKMVWEFHVFPHNTDDIDLAKRLADELDMELCVSKGWLLGEEWDPASRFQYFFNPVVEKCPFLWGQAIVQNDGGVAPCCGTFYEHDDVGRLAADGAGGARRFRDVWNNEKFRASRRFFRSRTGTDEEKHLACYECPMTKTWERYHVHRALGGAPETFQVGYGTQDVFNFFWSRRPAPAAEPRARRAAR